MTVKIIEGVLVKLEYVLIIEIVILYKLSVFILFDEFIVYM